MTPTGCDNPMAETLEQAIHRIGREIYGDIASETPSLFDTGTWNGRLMDWAMKDEAVKVQLFRFVDVLPALSTDELVVRLLREYFANLEGNPLLHGLSRISGLVPYVAARAIRSGAESLAKQFIAGSGPREAVATLKKLRKEGLAFSVDLLGEEVLSAHEAREYSNRYLELLAILKDEVDRWAEAPILDAEHQGPLPRLNISLKVTSFYSQIDPQDWEGSLVRTKEGLAPVLDAAQRLGAAVIVDMEHYYLKDFTIALFKELLQDRPDLEFAGIALQAYLRDTESDLSDLIRWARDRGKRPTVRLVKGAYWDYETAINRQRGWPVPVFTAKDDTDAQYESLTAMLLQHTDCVRPAIATHNVRSIACAMAVAESLDLPKDAFEFQMIYGMAEPIRSAVRSRGYRVRVYSPVGELIPGMAYLIRRLLENTSNESFLRKSFASRPSPEELLRKPQHSDHLADSSASEGAFRNEPALDFSKALNRQRMKDALDEVRRSLGKQYPLLIGGREVRARNESTSFNPARPDEIVGRVSQATKADAAEAVRQAAAAWQTWRTTLPEDRAKYLFKAADEMRSERFTLAALEVFEVGKTWPEADGDVAEAIDYLEYYAREMIRLGTYRPLGNYPGEANEYGYEPRGIGVVISPWNFPLAIATGMVSASVVTGNCAIFKPSGLSPVIGWKLAEIFARVGLPSGVLQFLPGPGSEVGEFLVAHPDVDFIAFTGSKEVGLRIVRLAGETHAGQRIIKRVVAEMGGKNAVIVDETADLDEAVHGVLQSALGFQGQKCSACSRVIVVGNQVDRFCSRLKEAMESIVIGPPEDPASFMGPVIDAAASEKIHAYIAMGMAEAKTVLVRRVEREGSFVGPAIFADVNPDSRLAQEEIFGPVLAVIRAADIDSALEIANGTPYALTGGIFSRSPANIRKAKAEFRVGNLYINRKITGALVGRQPFGGFGMSGVGSKAGGPDYLLQFMNIRTVSENTLRRGFAGPGTDAGRQ
jgi:RHH-type proline utilization regulon transcriptional repressor/proline dehydrogenase/delta 1-pyrroline-5-carboxylate dehydrogenase